MNRRPSIILQWRGLWRYRRGNVCATVKRYRALANAGLALLPRQAAYKSLAFFNCIGHAPDIGGGVV